MGLRVAEIDQQPVAQVFSYISLKAGYGSGAEFLIASDYLPEVFGV